MHQTAKLLLWEGTVGSTFLVLRAERSGGPYQQVYAGLDAYYADLLPPLSTRFYVVRAESRGGSSEFSSEASATTAPAAPTNLRVTPQTGAALLEWDAAEGASSYAVLRATSDGSYGVIPNRPEPRALHWASSVVAVGTFQP